jgi:hypothetical protein
MAEDLNALTEEFRKLGLERPESWASSQLNEGIPQLQRARVLYSLWTSIISSDDPGWIDRELKLFKMSEKARPGSGPSFAPHVAIIDRMLQCGFARRDISILVRQMQINALMNICAILDQCGDPPPEAAGTSFALFEVDDQGVPIRPVRALHESVHSFDHEARARNKASTRDRKGT